MNNEKIIEEMTRDILMLRREVERLAQLRPLYSIVNVNTPAQLTADQNNYNPGDYDLLRLSSNASRTITGISGGVMGRILMLANVGSNNIVISHNSASSLTENRIFNPGSTNITMTPLATGTFTYLFLYYTGSVWGTMFRAAP